MEWVPRAGSKFLVGGGGAGSKCGCLIKVGNLNPPVTLESSGELLFKAPVLTLFPQRVLFNWFDWDQPSDLKLKASQVIPARPQGWVYCRKKKKKIKVRKVGSENLKVILSCLTWYYFNFLFGIQLVLRCFLMLTSSSSPYFPSAKPSRGSTRRIFVEGKWLLLLSLGAGGPGVFGSLWDLLP